jgi:hypothetical protein
MATPIPTSRPAGRLGRPGGAGRENPAAGAPGASRLATAPRKRTRPYLLLGALLALVGAFAFAAALSRLGGRVAVLELSRGVSAGQVIEGSDLRSVQVAADSSVPLIPLASAGSVVGRRVALTLPAGTLLSSADLGAGSLPAAGQTMLSVQVKPGEFPTQLAGGATVAVARVTAAGQSAVPVVVPGLPTATVLSVTPFADSSGDVSVTLLAGQGAAGQIASIPPGSAKLIVLSSGSA